MIYKVESIKIGHAKIGVLLFKSMFPCGKVSMTNALFTSQLFDCPDLGCVHICVSQWYVQDTKDKEIHICSHCAILMS